MADFDPNVTQGAGAATPISADAPSPAIQGTSGGQSPTPAAQGTAPAQGGTQSPATGERDKDWVPSYRLRETRERTLNEARQFLEAKEREFAQREAEYKSKIAALAGFGPQPDPEVEGVRDQFGKLYPGLAKLEQRAADLLQMIERSGDLDAQTNHYWTSYGQTQMNTLFTMAEQDLGSPLSDEAKASLHASFVGYLQSSPELADAYASDPNFASKYWKTFSSSFIEPVRRVSAASAQGRSGVPVPQDTPGGVRTTPAPKPANLDERISSGWNAYQQSRRG